MLDVDAAIRAALARVVQRINERLAQHAAKPLTYYRRSVSQRLRRRLEREQNNGRR